MSIKKDTVTNVCAVRCCYRTYLHPNVRLFRFPKDPERCKKWAMACNQMVLYNYAIEAGTSLSKSYYRVCNRHFEDKYYSDEKKKRLNFHAIPTLNLTKAEILVNAKRTEASISADNIEPVQDSESSNLEQIIDDYNTVLDVEPSGAIEHYKISETGTIKPSINTNNIGIEQENSKCTQTRPIWGMSKSTQTMVAGTSTWTQTGLQLLKYTSRDQELRTKITLLRKKVKSLERQLSIEVRKHKAKHEMLVELLQKR